jgi:hypothetical protein
MYYYWAQRPRPARRRRRHCWRRIRTDATVGSPLESGGADLKTARLPGTVGTVLLHTPGKLSSLKSVNVHRRKDNAARPEKARPRGKNEWEERIYIVSLVLWEYKEIAYFYLVPKVYSYPVCSVLFVFRAILAVDF